MYYREGDIREGGLTREGNISEMWLFREGIADRAVFKGGGY